MTFFLFKIFDAIINFLAPQQKPVVPTAGKLSDISFPRANYGDPVPRWYGTAKFKAPNTIWDGDFGTTPVTKKVSSGLFSSKRETVGYNYFLGLDLAIALGPNFTFRRIWLGEYELWNGCLSGCENKITLALPTLFGGLNNKTGNNGGGFYGDIYLYCGSYTQSQNAYLQSKIFPDNADQVPAYNGIAHMVFQYCNWGTSTSIQPVYVEGSCFPDSLDIGAHNVMNNGFDMNPVSIIHHILTDDWGCLGIDPAKINVEQWQAAAETVWATNNGSSCIVANQGQAETTIQALLTQINATIFENPATGLYDMVLIQDDYELADLPVFGPGEVMGIQNFTKTLWSQTFNNVRIQFTDRTQGYKDGVTANANDFANIRFQNKVLTQSTDSTTIYDPTVANMVAARELSNVNIPLYSCTLTLNRMAYALPPGTPFILNWPEYGIVQMVMRVRKAGLGTLEDGTITLDVVQDAFSVADAIIAPPVTGGYVRPSTAPAAIVNPVVFELPYFLDYNGQYNTPAGQQTMAAFASPPSSYSIGFNGYITSAPEDVQVLTGAEYTPRAKLTAALGQFDGFANGIVPTMIIASVSTPSILIAGDVTTGSGLFMLNGELLAYESFVANNDGTYTLNNVHRALIDTAYVGGAIGDTLYFFDGQEATLNGAFDIGTLYELKLADVTPSGEFATPAQIPATPAGRRGQPLPPDNLTLGGARTSTGSTEGGQTVTLAWSPRSQPAHPASISLELGAADAVDAATVYKVEVVDQTGNVLLTADDIAANSYDVAFTDAMAPGVVLNVWAKLNGVLSFMPALYPVAVLSGIEIDGSPVTIDNERIDV